jgi:hypothetical protein
MPVAPLGLRSSEVFPLEQPVTSRCHYHLAIPLLTLPHPLPRTPFPAAIDPALPNRTKSATPPRREKRSATRKRQNPKGPSAQQATAALDENGRSHQRIAIQAPRSLDPNIRGQHSKKHYLQNTDPFPIGRSTTSTWFSTGSSCCRSVPPPEGETTRIAYRRTPETKASGRTADPSPPEDGNTCTV